MDAEERFIEACRKDLTDDLKQREQPINDSLEKLKRLKDDLKQREQQNSDGLEKLKRLKDDLKQREQQNGDGLEKLKRLQNDICEWSGKQFDNGHFTSERVISMSYHLQKESVELTEAVSMYFKYRHEKSSYGKKILDDVRVELADCLMLILDCSSHLHITTEDLVNDCFRKLEVNKARSWGKPDVNGVVEHVKVK